MIMQLFTGETVLRECGVGFTTRVDMLFDATRVYLKGQLWH